MSTVHAFMGSIERVIAVANDRDHERQLERATVAPKERVASGRSADAPQPTLERLLYGAAAVDGCTGSPARCPRAQRYVDDAAPVDDDRVIIASWERSRSERLHAAYRLAAAMPQPFTVKQYATAIDKTEPATYRLVGELRGFGSLTRCRQPPAGRAQPRQQPVTARGRDGGSDRNSAIRPFRRGSLPAAVGFGRRLFADRLRAGPRDPAEPT